MVQFDITDFFFEIRKLMNFMVVSILDISKLTEIEPGEYIDEEQELVRMNKTIHTTLCIFSLLNLGCNVNLVT